MEAEMMQVSGMVESVQEEKQTDAGEIWQRTKSIAWKCCQDINKDSLELEVVAGYLNVASEDALALANAMNKSFANLREIRLMAEQAAASHERYRRARQEWFRRCAI